MSGMLCVENVSLLTKSELHKICVWTVLCYSAECWALKENIKKLQRAEMRMICMMCGKTLADKCRSKELRRKLKVNDIEMFLREHRFRRFERIGRKDAEDMTRRIADMVVKGGEAEGDPRKHGRNW